jgi:Protein of unknown function (DUF3606)
MASRESDRRDMLQADRVKPGGRKPLPPADGFNKRLEGDRNRIDLSRRHEVRHWTKKWRVSPEELRAAVAKVGPSIETLDNELGKRLSRGHPAKPEAAPEGEPV